MAFLKKCAAGYNAGKGKLDDGVAGAIRQAATEICKGEIDFDKNLLLVVFQTGSGTQTNMNVSEVLSNRAIQILGGKVGSKDPVHPNNHYKLGQSSNDSIPTAMHTAAVEEFTRELMLQIRRLHEALDDKSGEFSSVINIGRTHCQDATPVTLGQVFSGYSTQLENSIRRVEGLLRSL